MKYTGIQLKSEILITELNNRGYIVARLPKIWRKAKKKMEESRLRFGIRLDKTYGAFLLGANINIGKDNEWYGYLCIYLGFRTLVIGRYYF